MKMQISFPFLAERIVYSRLALHLLSQIISNKYMKHNQNKFSL